MFDFRRSLVALVLVAAAATAAAAAQEHPGPGGGSERGHRAENSEPHGPGIFSLLPPDSVTEHSIALASGKLAYTATAGTLPLFNQSGERTAEVFYTAYVAKSDNPAARPITFVFNGGPGAASAFLNLGLVGPRIAQFGSSGHDGANVHLVDNPQSWLGFTDLVLIDPVGTGWSRAAKPDDDHFFWSVRGDAESMAKVVALYVAKNGRTSSPKFILGESYGGFRAAKVAHVLKDEQGIVVSGIVMLSPLLEGALEFGGDRFALGAALQLPSMAAAELERTGAFSKEALAQAAGPPPQGDAAKSFYERVAKMTGLPVDVVTRTRGFIRDDYVKNFAGDHKTVSHYDATFASDDPYPESASPRGPDPILDGFIRAYGSAFAGYARDELGFKTEMTYDLLDGQIAGKWDWNGGRAQASVTDDLRDLLALSPSFRLMIAHGYSDMVTPFSDSRYVLDHLPAFAAKRTELKLYRGGHMFYLDPDSRKAFTADVRTIYPAP
jgi:carboxypeptidase C (cathepsin A)